MSELDGRQTFAHASRGRLYNIVGVLGVAVVDRDSAISDASCFEAFDERSVSLVGSRSSQGMLASAPGNEAPSLTSLPSCRRLRRRVCSLWKFGRVARIYMGGPYIRRHRSHPQRRRALASCTLVPSRRNPKPETAPPRNNHNALDRPDTVDCFGATCEESAMRLPSFFLLPLLPGGEVIGRDDLWLSSAY